jgi:hypothetical protein
MSRREPPAWADLVALLLFVALLLLFAGGLVTALVPEPLT